MTGRGVRGRMSIREDGSDERLQQQRHRHTIESERHTMTSIENKVEAPDHQNELGMPKASMSASVLPRSRPAAGFKKSKTSL